MNYVIAGAGEVGSYLAGWLSGSQHNVIIIDRDLQRLMRLSSELDISAQHGSATDLQLLTKVGETKPDVFLAVTDQDEINLLACAMAKNLGIAQTIARVKNPQYLMQDKIDFQTLFMADHIICPDWSAAVALRALVQSEGDYACEFFADGAIQMRRIRINSSWKKEHLALRELDLPSSFKVAVIKRYTSGEPTIIFPHGEDHLLIGDELTLIGQSQSMHEADAYFDQQIAHKEAIFILGGSPIAGYLACLLEQSNINYQVTLIEPDASGANYWAGQLTKTKVIHKSNLTPDFLRSCQVSHFDLLIACTPDEHYNLTSCSLARELGVMATAAIINRPEISQLASHLQIQATICPNDYIASQIIKLASGTKISSVASVYSHRAEVIELHIGHYSKLTGIPLHRLAPHFPNEFLIGVVQHRARAMLAHGGTVLCPGDKVIAVSSPQHLEWIQKMV